MTLRLKGPIAGLPTPNYGGTPDAAGCRGCTDCCHLSELSITHEEAERLRAIYLNFQEPLGELRLQPDPNFEGWVLMKGPCVFRRINTSLAEGGCRIYQDRPASCDIFTCAYLLQLRRDQVR
jgi:Fe-S-cluster containining protein